MEIYLSQESCNKLIKTAESNVLWTTEDGGISTELYEKIVYELSTRDKDNKLHLSLNVADWVMSELDWYCSAYHD